MSQTCASPCLFLSHSGSDTDAARELKRRLLNSPDARAAGLRVWLDKDDLVAGLGWQTQLENAISKEATAFAVHVGASGIVNWVESEVRLGLSQAAAAPDYPFIPILAKECVGSAALPSFARQFQGVHDPLNDPEEFAKLLGAVLRRSSGETTIILDSPFVGLKAMTELDADRFFGRDEEIDELVSMLQRNHLIAVVADSGAGKSSLALAGLLPHFRGGALADTAGREPDGRVWHVVTMRPRRDPIEGLKRGVTEAAERLGRSTDQCAALRKRIDAADPSETAYAIRCDLSISTTETLLVVDQFEELLTETAEVQRASMVDLLMALEAIGGFRIVLTLRADHFNLCRSFAKLFEHLTRDNHAAVLRLRRITDAGLIEAVRGPLKLAGHTDIPEQDAVIESIRRDITDRAGDLALVQMALYAMWQKHRADGVNLLVAYSQVGGVVGALAHEAERVRTQRLDANERLLLAPLFIRLVRLGETGGATRRTADLADFDGPRRTLAEKLATEDCGRLLLTGERTVEIAHEALITQWPWLQNTLNEAAADMRVLDRLIDRARRWITIGERSPEHLATGAERTEFSSLAQRRPHWLSAAECNFVAASDEAERAARDRDRRRQQFERAAAVFFFALAVGATIAGVWAYRAQEEATQAQAIVAQTANTLVYDLGPEFYIRGLPSDLVGRVLERAIQGYDQAIQLDSNNAAAYVGRGFAYAIKGENDRAIQDYDRAVQFDPNNAAAHRYRGVAYGTKGNNDRAIQDLGRAIQLDPNDAVALASRGTAYAGNNQHDLAIEDYSRAIQLVPKNAAPYWGRGKSYISMKDYDRAIQDFDRAIELDPSSPFAYSSRGDAYSSKNDQERAIQNYDEAIRLDPKNAKNISAYTGRGLAYVKKGDTQRALLDFERAIQLDPKNAFAYVARGDVYRSKYDSNRAIKDYDQAVQLDPKSAAAYAGRGIAYAASGDIQRAIQDFDRAIQLDPQNTAAYTGRGIAYVNKGEKDRAIRDIDRAIELDPKNILAYVSRGSAYMSGGEYDRAVQDYDRAIQLDPGNPIIYLGRGLVHAAKRDYDRAVVDYDQALRLNPNLAAAFLKRGNAYASKGEQDYAIKDYDQAIQLDPKNPTNTNAYTDRAAAYMSKGDYDRAIPDYDQAILLDPNNFVAFVSRGRAYFYLGNFTAGAADLLRANEIQEGSYSMIWRYLARERAGENAAAELDKNAVRLKSAEWPYPVVELYLGRRSPADVLSAAGKADERCEAQFYIGEWHLLRGDRAAATTAFHTAAETCPKEFDEYTGALAELKRLTLYPPKP